MFTKKQLDQGLKVLKPEEVSQVSGGYTDGGGYGTELSQFPRKFWPVINPGAININTKIAQVLR